jgi:phage internal scaffolding protein
MAKMTFRTPYTDRERKGFETVGESLTQQHFKDETMIENVIRKHDRLGIVEHVQRGVAQYGDFSEINEYRESMDIINAANASFAALPSEIRRQFDNDAGEFFEFVTDPKNKDAMVKMGLAEAPVVKPAEAEKAAGKPSRPAVEEPAEAPAPTES